VSSYPAAVVYAGGLPVIPQRATRPYKCSMLATQQQRHAAAARLQRTSSGWHPRAGGKLLCVLGIAPLQDKWIR
jgi:hypothetical protein